MTEEKPVCRIKFKCTSNGHENIRELVLPVSCSTVADLKRLIEKQYSIPSCVQSLTLHDVPISDTYSICPAYHSKDEMLCVSFLSEADVSGVAQVVEWLKNLYAAVQRQSRPEISDLMQQEHIISCLEDKLFSPWDSRKKYVNKLYFDDCGGLNLLCSLYGFLVQLDSNQHMSHRILSIELTCARSIVNFCQSAELSRRVIQLGGLDMCITTFLHPGSTLFTHSSIQIGLSALWNLVEPCPEYHSVIAKNHDIIMQIMMVIYLPVYSLRSANVALSIIMTCIAESVDASPWTKEIVLGLIDASREKDICARTQDKRMIGFRCYMAATLAMMVIPSSHRLLEGIDHKGICKLMQTVLSTITPRMLQTYADQEMLTFSSHYPFIRLFYLPTFHSCLEDPNLKQEYVLSVKVLLLMLHGTLRRKVQFDRLCKEQMLDYITVLPWILPGELSQAASNIISDLSSHQPLQPPTLVNIVKARLASWQLGLGTVRNTSMRDIVDCLILLRNLGCQVNKLKIT